MKEVLKSPAELQAEDQKRYEDAVAAGGDGELELHCPDLCRSTEARFAMLDKARNRNEKSDNLEIKK